MLKTVQTGVYISHSANNHSHIIEYEDLYIHIKNVPNITKIWNSDQDSITDITYFVDEIKQNNIERIIIAGYRPGFLKPFFAKALNLAGKEATNVILADFFQELPENVSATEWAKSKMSCALLDIPLESILLRETNEVTGDTLVIGGGIAGIQASLEIANSHNKVFLVEKTGTIGGHMAMFDKTFPTLDCAACILTPKMVDVSQHEYIRLMTYSEVIKVSGEPGNYKVKILQKARRVNVDTCTGCGTCAEKCPYTAKSEFDAGTTMRKAIYIPFPQAVPNKYLVDENACRYIKTGKCKVCVKVCPVEGCIDLDEKDKTIEITVGNIVVATGFKTFDASRINQYGYGKYSNVVTSLELERLINASGPTGGKICLRSQDKKGNRIFEPASPEPESIALIHCVGSRDENYNKYCSRVCCMYSLKLAHLIKEKLPDAEVHEFYIDMRAFGKGYEEFYDRIKHEGVHIIRGKTAKIEEIDNQLLLRTEDIENSSILELKVDMVVLAVGLEPGDDSKQLADMLGIACSEDGWMREEDILKNTMETQNRGIHLAGTCQGAKDIPDSVVQASAAASGVIQSIMQNKVLRNLNNISPEIMQLNAGELSIINEE